MGVVLYDLILLPWCLYPIFIGLILWLSTLTLYPSIILEFFVLHHLCFACIWIP